MYFILGILITDLWTAKQSVFCVFKYGRAVKQKVWIEAENTERDWGETLRACEAGELGARKTLTPRLTDFFTDFEKKNRLFCSLTDLWSQGSGGVGR